MKKITKILSIMLVSALVFASCLKTDETETSPECVISSFSVGDIKSEVIVHRSSGVDTTITKTVSGSSIYFTIDQVNGIITTVDSIANWINLTKVVPTFTCTGNVYGKVDGDSLYYLWTSGSDSVNFTKPVDVVVRATDGISTKRYKVSIKQSIYSNDTINWSKVNNNLLVETDFKVVEYDKYAYIFFNNEGQTKVTRSSVENNFTLWDTPQSLEGADIDYQSVLVFKNELYGLDDDGNICKITKETTSYNAEKVSDEEFTTLLAADSYYIYATDGESIKGSTDLQTWTACGSGDIDMLPTSCYKSYSYKSKTNDDIQICVMAGLTDNNEKNGVSWYKISSDKEDINQDWMYIQVTNDNPYGLPKFKDMSVTMMNGKLYAIGIDPTNTSDTYKCIYQSDDNGITWHEKSIYPMPSDFTEAYGQAKIVAVDDRLWIIQKGGRIWCGVIR